MAEQEYLTLSAPDWRKNQCSKCGKWQFATGQGGETRQWQSRWCPKCIVEYGAGRRPEKSSRRRGAMAISQMLRRRSRRMPPDVVKRARPEFMYWEHMLRTFGLTKLDVLLMFHRQEGCCGICRCVLHLAKPANGKPRNVVVDHNHKTGKVRGLLCQRCNITLTPLERDDWMPKAMAYLEGTD